MYLYNKKLNKEIESIETTHNSVYSETLLPVLDALMTKAFKEGKAGMLNKTAIFYVHHPLKTSINVIDALINLGAKPEYFFVLGKKYSECESVVSTLIEKGVNYQPCSMQTGVGQYAYSFIRDINWLWAKLVEKIDAQVEQILIIDHGGHAITYLPLMLLDNYKIIGIEKTTSGFINTKNQGIPPIPIIDVANSAAKRFLESPLIADAIVNKIEYYLPKNINDFVFGVIGLGAIGKAVINKLTLLGCRLIVHDIDSSQESFINKSKDIIFTDKISALIASADYIFGCSGHDISFDQLEIFRLATKNKTLISCSSEDKEYLSLLQMINKQAPNILNPMKDIEFKTKFGASILLIRGGFPVNFDDSGESVPANDIQLTRSLVLAAVLQALDYLNMHPSKPTADRKLQEEQAHRTGLSTPGHENLNTESTEQVASTVGFRNRYNYNSKAPGIYALDKRYQRFVIHEWFKHQNELRFNKEQLSRFLDEDWLANNSSGLNNMLIQQD